ncbi:hypothetical protein KCV06_g209, partial [Aureobasidium melanogenum]
LVKICSVGAPIALRKSTSSRVSASHIFSHLFGLCTGCLLLIFQGLGINAKTINVSSSTLSNTTSGTEIGVAVNAASLSEEIPPVFAATIPLFYVAIIRTRSTICANLLQKHCRIFLESGVRWKGKFESSVAKDRLYNGDSLSALKCLPTSYGRSVGNMSMQQLKPRLIASRSHTSNISNVIENGSSAGVLSSCQMKQARGVSTVQSKSTVVSVSTLCPGRTSSSGALSDDSLIRISLCNFHGHIVTVPPL